MWSSSTVLPVAIHCNEGTAGRQLIMDGLADIAEAGANVRLAQQLVKGLALSCMQ